MKIITESQSGRHVSSSKPEPPFLKKGGFDQCWDQRVGSSQSELSREDPLVARSGEGAHPGSEDFLFPSSSHAEAGRNRLLQGQTCLTGGDGGGGVGGVVWSLPLLM